LIQTSLYTFVISYLFYTFTHLYYYAFLALKTLKFQENALKLSIFHAKNVVLRNDGNFEVHIYSILIKKICQQKMIYSSRNMAGPCKYPEIVNNSYPSHGYFDSALCLGWPGNLTKKLQNVGLPTNMELIWS
jgi:hypothetical protein